MLSCSILKFQDQLSTLQRRRLAVKGKILGRKALQEIATIVTSDTILRWHWQLVAQKWDYSDRRKGKSGRPHVSKEITKLVLLTNFYHKVLKTGCSVEIAGYTGARRSEILRSFSRVV